MNSLVSMWKEPCKIVFHHLSFKHPDSLVKIVESGVLGPYHLRLALESLNIIETSEHIRDLLISHMGSHHPTVRSGALHGFLKHMREDDVGIFEHIICEDPDQSVRNTAIDVLLSFCDSILNRDV